MVTKTQLTVVCAWCGKPLGIKDGHGVSGVSHGICPKCSKGTTQPSTIETCQYAPGNPCPHDGRCRLCDLYLRLYGHKCGLTARETIVELLDEFAFTFNPNKSDTSKLAEQITEIAITDYKRTLNRDRDAGIENGG